MLSRIFVSIKPGEMQLTVTFLEATSFANDLENPSTADFDAT